MSARIQEDLGAIQVIKTYGLEDLRRGGFLAGSKRLLDKNMEAAKVRVQLGPTLNALAATATVLLLLVGGRAVIDKDMSIGDYAALSLLLARLVWPTLTLGFMLALVQRGRASWSRLVQLQDTVPDIAEGTGEPLGTQAGPAHVTVTGLTIQIGERTLLDDVSFELAPGTVTAIVGRTGAGKSTLVEALCRLMPVPPGAIAIDGRDITTLPLASLRAQIGYAPQEAFLFSTTIADNIAMGYGGGTAIPAARRAELERAGAAESAPDLSHEPRVTASAEAAGLVRDLAVMPEELATIVGERGITLSGGQRQRVALARALAASPRLLVLDDSLASVDAETERVILGNLKSVMAGRTAALISHRVAAIKDADQIVGARSRQGRRARNPRRADRARRRVRRALSHAARHRARHPGCRLMAIPATSDAPRRSGLEAEQVLGKAYDLRLLQRIATYVKPHTALLGAWVDLHVARRSRSSSRSRRSCCTR